MQSADPADFVEDGVPAARPAAPEVHVRVKLTGFATYETTWRPGEPLPAATLRPN